MLSSARHAPPLSALSCVSKRHVCWGAGVLLTSRPPLNPGINSWFSPALLPCPAKPGRVPMGCNLLTNNSSTWELVRRCSQTPSWTYLISTCILIRSPGDPSARGTAQAGRAEMRVGLSSSSFSLSTASSPLLPLLPSCLLVAYFRTCRDPASLASKRVLLKSFSRQ